jgi:hypothetical protein
MTYWTNISFVISFPLLFKEMVENKLALWLWISWNCFYILWSATTVTKWLNKNNESSQCRWPRGDHLMLMAMSLSKQRCFKFWKCNNEALHNSTLSMSVAQLLLWLGSRMRGCGTCGLVLRSSKYSFLFSVLAGCTVHLSSCPVGKRSFFFPPWGELAREWRYQPPASNFKVKEDVELCLHFHKNFWPCA